MSRRNRGYTISVSSNRRKYGLLHFLFDIFMVFVTYGLWLVWIFIREMRR